MQSLENKKILFSIDFLFLFIIVFFAGMTWQPIFVHADYATCINSNPDVLGGMQNTDCAITAVPVTNFNISEDNLELIFSNGSNLIIEVAIFSASTTDPLLVYSESLSNTFAVTIEKSDLSPNSNGLYYYSVTDSNYSTTGGSFYLINNKFYEKLANVQQFESGFSYGEILTSLLLLLILTALIFHTFWARIFGTKLSVPFYRTFLGNNSKEGKEIKNI